MKKSFNKIFISSALIVAVLVLTVAPALRVARADALTNMKATLSTLKVNTVANQTVMFRLSSGGGGVAATETITLTYGSDFAIPAALDFEDIDVSYQASGDGVCDTGDTELTLAATASGATWGAIDTTTSIITITSGSGTIAAGAEVCVEIGTNAESVVTGIERITNATTAASRNLTLGGTNGDTGTIVITTVTDDVVVATATVPASLTFTVTDNDIFFGTLSATAAQWADNTADGSATVTAGHTMTIGTNSPGGYTVTYNGTTLASTGTPADTISVATISGDEDGTPTSEQYAIGVTTDGNTTIPTAYAKASNNYSFVASTTTTIASETVASATETLSIYYIANIAANTEAHTDYSSSVTYIGTGNF